MKRFGNKLRHAALLCCVTGLLTPLSGHGREAGETAGKGASMQGKAVEVMAEPGRATSDMRMHRALERKLAENENLNTVRIDTEVENARVYLTGEVQNGAQRQLVAELAANVEGVTEVQNNLIVRSADPDTGERISKRSSDAALTAQVKSRLMVSNNTSGLAIDIHTVNNVVTLEGEVGSDTERELAGLIAGNTLGVSAVLNKLRVRPD